MSRRLRQLAAEIRATPRRIRRQISDTPRWMWNSFYLELTFYTGILTFVHITRAVWPSFIMMAVISVSMQYVRELIRRRERNIFFDIVDRDEYDDLWDLTDNGEYEDEEDEDDGEW